MSETSTQQQQRHMQVDVTLQQHRCENQQLCKGKHQDVLILRRMERRGMEYTEAMWSTRTFYMLFPLSRIRRCQANALIQENYFKRGMYHSSYTL